MSFFFSTHGSVHRNSLLIKIQPDATVCRYLFTAESEPLKGTLGTDTNTTEQLLIPVFKRAL